MKSSFFQTIIKGLTIVGQLGIDIVVPPVLLAFIARKICERFNMGEWVIVLAVIIGILTAIASTISYFRKIVIDSHKEAEQIKTVSFRKHK